MISGHRGKQMVYNEPNIPPFIYGYTFIYRSIRCGTPDRGVAVSHPQDHLQRFNDAQRNTCSIIELLMTLNTVSGFQEGQGLKEIIRDIISQRFTCEQKHSLPE